MRNWESLPNPRLMVELLPRSTSLGSKDENPSNQKPANKGEPDNKRQKLEKDKDVGRNKQPARKERYQINGEWARRAYHEFGHDGKEIKFPTRTPKCL